MDDNLGFVGRKNIHVSFILVCQDKCQPDETFVKLVLKIIVGTVLNDQHVGDIKLEVKSEGGSGNYDFRFMKYGLQSWRYEVRSKRHEVGSQKLRFAF
jgi:hypothetical protein